jgi:hypothetical protein
MWNTLGTSVDDRLNALNQITKVMSGCSLDLKWSYEPMNDQMKIDDFVKKKMNQISNMIKVQNKIEKMYIDEIQKINDFKIRRNNEENLIVPHLHLHSHIGEVIDGSMSGGIEGV